MNLQPRHDDEDRAVLNMVPMVDVVFMLLSFFILATQFRLHERDFPMGHERAALARGSAAEDFPRTIPVRLRDTGGQVAITLGRASLGVNAFEALRAKLTEINLPQVGVTILADPTLTVEQVARAMDAVLASPMRNLSVAKAPQEAPGKERVAP